MRQLALLLTIALSALPSYADTTSCTGPRIYSGAFRASVLDVSLDGQRLWAATSYGVTLYDASIDPPAPLGSLALPGATTRVRAVNGNAFVGSGSRLYVLRENGGEPSVIGSVEVGGTINDLLLVSNYLYAATSTGVVQIDTIVPGTPAVTARLATTSGRALSVTRFESTLFAADGDATVEMFSIQVPAFPQRLATFTGLPQSTSVRVAGLNLLVSDGQQTQMFTVGNPPVKIGSPINVASNALFSYEGAVAFVAGQSRTLRAVDFSSTPAVVFSADLPISRGSINRIEAITGRAGRIYAAAGDMGLATFDVSNFHAPYPQRAVALGSFTSLGRTSNGVVVSRDSGGLTFYSVAANSDLPLSGPTWEPGKTWMVHDSVETTVVASSGRTLSVWNLAGGTAALTSTATFPENVVDAVLVGTRIYAITENASSRTVWQGDIATNPFVPAKVSAGVTLPYFISRSGSAVGIVEITEEGKTIISYWSTGDLSATPQRVEVEGAATSGLALSAAGRAAVATFLGISIVQFPAGTVTVIPNVPPGRDLAFDGERLLFATDTRLLQFETATATQSGVWSLPATASRLQVGPATGNLMYALTDEGIVSVRPASVGNVPALVAAPVSNRYYRDLAVGGGHLVLADGAKLDVFLTRVNGAPSFAGSVELPFAPVAIAADAESVFALSANGRVVAYGYGGVEKRAATFDEGADASFQNMRLVAGALHVTILRGCSVGACEKKTLVLDPGSLAQTAVYAGGLVDAVVDGSTAWVLVDSPNELRRLNVSDPLHPSTSASQSLALTNPAQLPIALGRSAATGLVYVLGAKLTAYDEGSLVLKGEMLEAFVEDPSGRVGYLDQRLSVAGSCVVVSGRAFSPQVATLINPTTVSAFTSLQVPAAGKRMVVQDGVTYVLTDYSLEVYSQKPAPARRRGVR